MENNSGIIEQKEATGDTVTVLKRYKKGKLLGKGGFAKCYEVKDLDSGKILAAKIIDKTTLGKNRSRRKLMSEIKIHKIMNHHNIVHFEEYFEDSHGLYILLELCPYHTLKELVKKRKCLHELEAEYYMHQLILGVKYIHSQQVIHRDIKLGNLFLGKDLEIKIGDFGLAAKLDFVGEKRRTICGTPNYIAPEVLSSKVCGHSFEADVWSIGVVLYAMLVGKPPFETKDVKTTYKRIKANDFTIPDEANLSYEAKSLINATLVTNPTHRITLDQMLQHPFMTKNKIPPNLPMSSLTSALPSDFIDQFERKPLRSEIPRRQIQSTMIIKKKSEVLTKEQLKKPARILDKVTSQVTIENRLSTARLVTKPEPTPTNPLPITNNFVTNSAKPLPQVKPGVLGSTMKQGSTELKIMKEVAVKNMQKKSTLPTQHSLATSHSNMSNPSVTFRRIAASAVPTERHMNEIAEYIQYYTDYSEKYGIGYVMSNGSIGFYFNDMTNLLWLKRRNQYSYTDFFTKGGKAEPIYITEDCHSNNKDMIKKLKIFAHYRNHCNKLNNEGTITLPELPSVSSIESETALRRIIKTKNGMYFRFTSNVVQMAFIDQSQIILCFKTKTLIYINKKEIKQTFKIGNDLILSASEKIVSKFKYVVNLVNYLNSSRGARVKQTERTGSNYGLM